RNSGVTAVVEGVGDHGCEYMTGGRVLILGPVGRNFGAGMSGGVAYVLDEAGDFAERCSTGNVSLRRLDATGREVVRDLAERHLALTGSARAKQVLNDFESYAKRFMVLVPTDYERIMEALEDARSRQLSEDEGLLYAFNAVVLNKKAG
ncbi:MAG: hypothetical protein LBD25_05360, partial [Coriobacteriales bacterium]|nr:hypothetical protein [Coriobacteriales bacterium]